MVRSEGSPRCRRLVDWPDRDRDAWKSAVSRGDLLHEEGLAARWSDRSREKTEKGYGFWLEWLDGRCLLDAEPNPEVRVTPERVIQYVADLSVGRSGYTMYCRMQELYDAIRVMVPRTDWDWLRRVQNAVRARATPVRDKQSRLRPAPELVALGRKLMAEAEAETTWTLLRRAVHYRDGLMIALLAYRALRLKNYQSMALGVHLVIEAGAYWLHYAASETKNKERYDAPFPESLVANLQRYLESYRPVLLTCGDRYSAPDHHAVWVAETGEPLQDISLHNRIRKHTKAAFGKALPPHWFRDCAITFSATNDPVHARSAMHLIGDRSLEVAEKHYNQGQSLEVSRRHGALIEALRRSLPR